MKQLRMLVSTLWILGGLLVVSSWSSQQAYAMDLAAEHCPSEMMVGSYEFVAPTTVNVGNGTVIAIPDHLLYASPAVYASKGTLIVDDTGQITLNAQENVNGPLTSPVQYYADYVMNSDCTATATFADGIQLGLKTVNRGSEDRLVSTTPGFVILWPAP